MLKKKPELAYLKIFISSNRPSCLSALVRKASLASKGGRSKIVKNLINISEFFVE